MLDNEIALEVIKLQPSGDPAFGALRAAAVEKLRMQLGGAASPPSMRSVADIQRYELEESVAFIERYYAPFMEEDTKERVLVDGECLSRLAKVVRRMKANGYL